MPDRKRVVFCTYASLYSSIVLRQLLNDSSIDVVAIVNSTRLHHPKYGHLRGALKQLSVSGLRYSTYLLMVTDVYAWLKSCKNPINCRQSIKNMAKEYAIPVLYTRDINDSDAVQFINQVQPDYLLAAHFNQLVKPVLLDSTDYTCINIHPSLLPAYQGVDPVFYALLNDEKQTGVSVHRMSESFDKGELLAQREMPIQAIDSVCALNKKLFHQGAQLAINWIKNEIQPDLIRVNPDQGNYDSWPSARLVSRLKKQGKVLIRKTDLFQGVTF